MTIEFHCPHCNEFLSTEDERAGLEARCPGCHQPIEVPAFDDPPSFENSPEPSPDHPDPPDDAVSPTSHPEPERLSEANPSGTTATQNCPNCGADIDEHVKRCPYCSQNIDTDHGVPSHFEITAGNLIEESWRIYSGQMGECILAFFVITGVGFVGTAILMVGMIALLAIVGGVGEPALVFVLALPVLMLVYLFSAYITAGMNYFFVQVARGRPAKISYLFEGAPFTLRMLLIQFVISILVLLGTLACVVPGILILMMLWPSIYVLVDKDPPGLEALAMSKEFTSGHMGTMFLVFLVCLGMYIAGGMLGGFGLIFILPYIYVILAVMYVRMADATVIERMNAFNRS